MKTLTTLETQRLLIRKPLQEDSSRIFLAYASDSEVTKYLTWKPHQYLSETESFISLCIEKWAVGNEFHCIIEKKESFDLVGMIMVREIPDHCSIGYVIRKEDWNKGYASEALNAMLAYVFTNSDKTKVITTCDVENVKSAKVMEKNGMKNIGIQKGYVLHPNVSDQMRDVQTYEMTKEEYIKKCANSV